MAISENRKLKKWIIIIAGIVIFVLIVLVIAHGSEDDWIRDSRGVWIKHGNPTNIPTEVAEQQELIAKAQELYRKAKEQKQNLVTGPCLGKISADWVADIVHSPRQDVDGLPQNQCSDFRQGLVSHFIELDPDGNILKVD